MNDRPDDGSGGDTSPVRVIPLDEGLAGLPLPPTETWPNGVFDIELLRVGDVSLEVFAPRGTDRQSPHEQDEIYLVATGSAVLVTPGARTPVRSGDAAFVRAGHEHRFEEMTPDFATWVIFFGPPTPTP